MGPTPYYLQSQVVSAYHVLGLKLHSFFVAKVPFLSFLNMERGVVI